MTTTRTAAADPAAPLLTVRDLRIDFPSALGPVRVVDGVSFDIDHGQTLGVVGESGSGKSMSSLAIMGLLPPDAVVTGSILLNGVEIIGRNDREMRRVRGKQAAMIFQDPLSSLNPYLTVGRQISEAYRAHHPVTRRVARDVAIRAMERVSIADAERRFDHFPHQFSGGMRQRIMIAMALSCGPGLVIADEPTTALDVTVQAQILELLSELQRETGAGMLFITHDLAVVAEMADRVTVMRYGRQLETGTAEQIFSDPQTEYTHRLLDATPRIEDEPVAEHGKGEGR